MSETQSLLNSRDTNEEHSHGHKAYVTIQTYAPSKHVNNQLVEQAHHHVEVPHSYGALCQTDHSAELALLQMKRQETEEVEREVSYIINLSLFVNVILFGGKVAAYLMSGSLSVAASVVDSFLDLLVQLIIHLAHSNKTSDNRKLFPAGTSRFEPVGLIICAALMFIACLQLISSSVVNLYDGITGGTIDTVIDIPTILVILAVIGIKSWLWLYCRVKAHLSDTVGTLAFDHRNDVLSNIVACLAIALVRISPTLWWTDALGCIIISVYIANNWYELAMEKVNELVGRAADNEFVSKVTELINEHHSALTLDVIRAYHFGLKYLVELEVIVPPETTVAVAHDLALDLQHAVEKLEEVERAFVHVDYMKRSIDEHDVEAMVRHKAERSASAEATAMPVSPVAAEV